MASEPFPWARSPFVVYSDDRVPMEAHIVFVTDPDAARVHWQSIGSHRLLKWANDGFPGVCQPNDPHWASARLDYWILSPDPGKEV